MKKTIFLVLTCLFFGSSLHAQIFSGKASSDRISGTTTLWYTNDSPFPSYIKFEEGSEPLYADLNSWITESLKIKGFEYREVNRITDEMGLDHIRFQQTFNGIPIHHAIFILHIKNGRIQSVNGTFCSFEETSNHLTLDAESALDAALKHVGATSYKWQNPSEEAWLKSFTNNPAATWYPEPKKEIILTKNDPQYRVCYKFNIYAEKPLYHSDVYVDAQTGEILLELNRIHTTDVPGTAVTKFSGTQPITTDSVSPGVFRLRETGRGNGIATYNLAQGTNYSAAVDFTDSDNYWNNVNAQMDEVATDAHWGAEKTYDYFWFEHGRNSIDGNGFQLLSYVHYDANYANAFWDGTRMTYGDGNGSYDPFTALDVCAHEITHGLDSYTADLIYADESGALNEGFSDIFGIAVEFYARPSNANWNLGEDIGVVLRNISNPANTQNPDTYLGNDWDPGMEVHQNSTVFSHWFYRTAMGGSGTNDNGDAFSISGIGIDKAAEIAFRMLTVYLTNSSGFNEARFYAIVSATDLFGGCSPEVAATTNAMYAVGVGPAYVANTVADFDADQTTLCSAPATIQFTNLTTNGQSYLWDFGDGSTSTTSSPSHVYTATGDYDVKLIADGGPCGIDSITQTAFVSILPTNSNYSFIPATGTGPVQTCCTGTLFDNGVTSNYSNNTNGIITIAPVGASYVTLTFSSFNLESGYDYLYVYNGPGTTSPVIGVYDGSSLPNGGVITSTGSAITLRQTSDAGVVSSGFELQWQCSYPNTAPTTNFTASGTSTCTGVIDFTDLSTNGPVNWLWDFGDGNTSSLQNPTHAYASNGTFTVTLTTSNSFGSDSLVKSNYITVNAPASPSVTPGSVCDSGNVTLSASGSGQLEWYDAAIAGNLVHTGSTFVTPMIYNTTSYYVEDKIIQPSVYGGKTSNSGSGGYFGNPAYIHYLIFNTYTPLTLKSVKVYAQGDANRTILLRDSMQNILQSATVFIPDGESRVTLNFDLPVQNKLQLVGDGSPDLFRNNNGSAVYPYTTSGMFSIIQSSASLPPNNSMGNYYYFYDWEVSEPTCSSPRVEVTATVNPCGGFEESDPSAGLNIYPNPANDGHFTVGLWSMSNADATIEICDVSGRLIYSGIFETHTGMNTFKILTANISAGVYSLTIRSEGTTKSRKLFIE